MDRSRRSVIVISILLLAALLVGLAVMARGCIKGRDSTTTDICPTGESVDLSKEETAEVPVEDAVETTSDDVDQTGLVFERVENEVTYTADDGAVLIFGKLVYPKVTLPDNSEAATKINEFFAGQMEEDTALLEEYRSWAEGDYQSRVEEERADGWGGYAYERDHEVTFAGARLLSIRQAGYQYTGGAHPIHFVYPRNFDLQTGGQVALMDLTDDPEGMQAFLWEAFQVFVKESKLEDGLYPDYEETVKTGLAAPLWYVYDGELIIVFNEYEIAPYAAGIIEVAVPLAELELFWNDYGRSLLAGD